MIIKKHEAASTKLALQDISQHFGDAVFIISNTRLEGRNVVYFATDTIEPVNEKNRAASLEPVSEVVSKPDLAHHSRLTSRRKPAARKYKQPEITLPGPLVESNSPLIAEITSLEAKIERLEDLVGQTANSMVRAETAAGDRLDCIELLQRKQKSGIDQLNRRMARQTELLSAILASMETRQTAVASPHQDYPNRTSSPAPALHGYGQCSFVKSPTHLLTYLKNNGSLHPVSAFASGIHAILTDAMTGSSKSVQEFCELLGRSATGSLPRLICFSGEKTPKVVAAAIEVAVDESELVNSIGKRAKNRPTVVFISTRDYLNQAREFKCLDSAKIHCYYMHSTALEQLAFLEEVHRLRPESLSIAEVPEPTRGLPELFSLMTGGVPILFLGYGKNPLSTVDETIPGYLGISAANKARLLTAWLLGRLSLAARLTNTCTVMLRRLASRVLPKSEQTDGE